MTISTDTRTALTRLARRDPDSLRGALTAVAKGEAGAAEALSKKSGVDVGQLRAAAALAFEHGLDALFEASGDKKTAATTGSDHAPAFHAADGGHDAAGLFGLRAGKNDDVESLGVKGNGQDFTAHARSTAQVFGASARGPLESVPSARDLLRVRSGDVPAEKVAAALVEALVSSSPAAVKKAARTLQVYESYRRKADQDAKNYAHTGFSAFKFPKLDLPLAAGDAKKLAAAAAGTHDPATADIVVMLLQRGILKASPADREALLADPALKKLTTGDSGQLKASDGVEHPRGGCTGFFDEWNHEVLPGLDNIQKAIIETAKKRGATCPFARGNHAKGVEFGDVTMKTADAAPDWVKDLFGKVVKGGMIRVSGSQTNPDEPDSKPHQPGVRIVLPLEGSLDKGTARQVLDITANAGQTTHANTARKHTLFTERLTTAPDGTLADSTPGRLVRFLGEGIANGELFERIGEIKSAQDACSEANKQAFHEHQLYGRHAYFIGGRYVQFRVKVVEPTDFPNPSHDKAKNAALDAVSGTVAREGMKVALYVTEIPEGKPWLAEEEGWQGLRDTEYLAGTFEVPPQQATKDSAAHEWMHENTFAQSKDLLAQPVGLGRHRIPAYHASWEQRLKHRPGT